MSIPVYSAALQAALRNLKSFGHKVVKIESDTIFYQDGNENMFKYVPVIDEVSGGLEWQSYPLPTANLHIVEAQSA